MKPLTPKEQKFAELCVSLGNQTEAYRQTYGVENEGSEWVKVEASKVAKRPNVSMTIQNLKGELQTQHKITREVIIKGYLEIINDVDLTFAMAQEDLSKEDRAKFFRMMQQTKNTDKLRALESLAKMMGLNEPDKTEHTIKSITIEEKRRDD